MTCLADRRDDDRPVRRVSALHASLNTAALSLDAASWGQPEEIAWTTMTSVVYGPLASVTCCGGAR